MFGAKGDDVLIGGAGNDVLQGGAGADVFKFSPRLGIDEILDFNPAEGDQLVLEGCGVDAFSSLEPHLAQQGNDVQVAIGSDQVILRNLQIAELTAAQVSFA